MAGQRRFSSVVDALSGKYIADPATGCHEWTGCIQANGYGRMTHAGKTDYAHRWSYSAFLGPIPSGKQVCHTCDNRKCINPSHFFLGEAKENSEDAQKKGRLSSGERHGRLIRGEDGPSKLTWDQVREIRRLRASGSSLVELSEIYSVDASTVGLIARNKTWLEV